MDCRNKITLQMLFWNLNAECCCYHNTPPTSTFYSLLKGCNDSCFAGCRKRGDAGRAPAGKNRGKRKERKAEREREGGREAAQLSRQVGHSLSCSQSRKEKQVEQRKERRKGEGKEGREKRRSDFPVCHIRLLQGTKQRQTHPTLSPPAECRRETPDPRKGKQR